MTGESERPADRDAEGADASSVVRFEDVALSFGGTPALDHVSFEMGAGETRIIFGAAGSGKTTLLKAAMGLIRANSGRIFLFGQDITHMKEQELFKLRARVGILFQEGGLFDSLTVEENVAYPLLNQPALRESLAETNGAEWESLARWSVRPRCCCTTRQLRVWIRLRPTTLLA